MSWVTKEEKVSSLEVHSGFTNQLAIWPVKHKGGCPHSDWVWYLSSWIWWVATVPPLLPPPRARWCVKEVKPGQPGIWAPTCWEQHREPSSVDHSGRVHGGRNGVEHKHTLGGTSLCPLSSYKNTRLVHARRLCLTSPICASHQFTLQDLSIIGHSSAGCVAA